MNNKHQSWWTLGAGEARSLCIGPGKRELVVKEGRLWLTGRGSPQAPAQDIWLEAGESINLPSGAQVVIEAWPSAAFQLLVPPSRSCAASTGSVGGLVNKHLERAVC